MKLLSSLRRIHARIRRDLRVTVCAGIFLVLVPTLFAMFPSWGDWSVRARIPILVLWFLVAVLVVASAERQSRQIEDLVGEPMERRQRDRDVAGARLVRALLTPPHSGFPSHYEFRLYLPDDTGRLMPSFEPDGTVEESEGWRKGQGATGIAWESDTRVVAHGAAVHDGTYGLTEAQQEKYKQLAVVAALRVTNARGHPLAVLSVSSENDDGYVDTDEGRDGHIELAEIVARILIDVLRLGHD